MFELVLHPAEKRKPRHRVHGYARRNLLIPEHVSLAFEVKGEDSIAWPSLDAPASGVARRDELWKSTCFECFVAPAGKNSYLEWNFSPNGNWQAYEFKSYRNARIDAAVKQPSIQSFRFRRYEIDFELPPDFSSTSLELSLTCVMIEVGDSQPYYWALQHNEEKPDFHARQSFSLRLDL